MSPFLTSCLSSTSCGRRSDTEAHHDRSIASAPREPVLVRVTPASAGAASRHRVLWICLGVGGPSKLFSPR
jgi:hypothetical protein